AAAISRAGCTLTGLLARYVGIHLPARAQLAVRRRRTDKRVKQRVGPRRAALELRVELATDHERVTFNFGDLDEATARRDAAEQQARLLKLGAEGVVDLEAMAVPLVDLAHLVGLGSRRSGLQHAGVVPQPHRAAEVG